MTATYDEIARYLAPNGLLPRGGFAVGSNMGNSIDLLNRCPNAKTVILVGHGGGGHWQHFTSWQERQDLQLENPLDAWSDTVVSSVARELQADAVFPWQKPYLPFQQWAIRAEGLKTSPVGVLMHPEYGVWHAYRGALVFSTDVEIPQHKPPHHHCDTCENKPCLSACPAYAFTLQGLKVEACATHLNRLTANPSSPNCHETGCLARGACPVATEHRYSPQQIRFHMRAYYRSIGPLGAQ